MRAQDAAPSQRLRRERRERVLDVRVGQVVVIKAHELPVTRVDKCVAWGSAVPRLHEGLPQQANAISKSALGGGCGGRELDAARPPIGQREA